MFWLLSLAFCGLLASVWWWFCVLICGCLGCVLVVFACLVVFALVVVLFRCLLVLVV